MTSLLDLIRERRAELEAKAAEESRQHITDEDRVAFLCKTIAGARLNPNGQEAANLQQLLDCGPDQGALMEGAIKEVEEIIAALRELIREHVGLEVTDDRSLAATVYEQVSWNWRHPAEWLKLSREGRNPIEWLDRFRESDPVTKVVVEEYAKVGRSVPRDTASNTLSRSIRGMSPCPGGPQEDAERPGPPRWAVGDDQPPAATIFDVAASVRFSSPVRSHLQPIPFGRNQSWHKDKPDPVNPGTGWMRRR